MSYTYIHRAANARVNETESNNIEMRKLAGISNYFWAIDPRHRTCIFLYHLQLP